MDSKRFLTVLAGGLVLILVVLIIQSRRMEDRMSKPQDSMTGDAMDQESGAVMETGKLGKGKFVSVENGVLTYEIEGGQESITLSDPLFLSCTRSELSAMDIFDIAQVEYQYEVEPGDPMLQLTAGEEIYVQSVSAGEAGSHHLIAVGPSACPR